MRNVRFCMALGLILAMSGIAGATSVATFVFDPVDFFNYNPVSDGFSTDGGMFKLTGTWGDTGTMYRSWDSGQRATVDNFADGLSTVEGICQFNIWLADHSNAPLWGETLVSSGTVMPTGTAPVGWTASVGGNPWPDGDNGLWLVNWSTDDPTKYIRPGNSVGDFGFSFLPTTSVVPGENYTIWFGGVNYGADDAALVFDEFEDGFDSQFVATYGTGFEATLSLSPVPEPITMLGLFMGIGGLAGYIRKRRMA